MRMIEEEGLPGVADTLYLCNFRVTVDGEWLCLKELVETDPGAVTFPPTPSPSDPPPHMFIGKSVNNNEIESVSITDIARAISRLSNSIN